MINESNIDNSVININSMRSLIARIKLLEKRAVSMIFIAMDGDAIGATVEQAAMTDDLATIVKQSRLIAEGQKLIRDWAIERGGKIIIDGGDDISFTLPSDKVGGLEDLRKKYHETTGFTVTVGVGDKISRAGHAMLYGKLNGKDQLNVWSPELQKKLEEQSKDETPKEKLKKEKLL